MFGRRLRIIIGTTREIDGREKEKKIAERAIPMTISASVEKTSSVPIDDVVFLLNIGDKEQLSLNDNRTLVDSNSTQIFEQFALTDAFNTTTEEQKAPMTASGRKAFSQDQISITSSMTAAPGPALNSTLTPLTTPHSDNPHFDRELNTWVYSFDDFLPYPSVYFSVMVIAGKYRPRPPSQRNPAGVTVFSRGENLPSGYTHIVKAFPFDNGHVIRILDPAASDVLVEFSFIVLKDGHECQRLCLYRRRYIECRRNTVRLSKYSALSDRVDFYKYGGFEYVRDNAPLSPIISYFQTTRQVIDRRWKGAGYFRRRTQDAFIFICPSD
ncbi:hypothetical protein NECAME_18121 [Necator americanus]|uniref:Uncharacterized protein n=1 Tax=Necator americanus TaxID=51031 RepID=W2TEI6_NECAM|nr:hypothetical protein NECAME_18121 [Necator americanus]ETN79412.1 hypothetical protein NECAME_18121 [Necator americanus]